MLLGLLIHLLKLVPNKGRSVGPPFTWDAAIVSGMTDFHFDHVTVLNRKNKPLLA